MGKDFLVLFRRLVLIIIRFENPIMKTTSRMWGRLFSFSNFFIKSLKNPNSKVQQGFQLENYGFQLEQLH